VWFTSIATPLQLRSINHQTHQGGWGGEGWLWWNGRIDDPTHAGNSNARFHCKIALELRNTPCVAGCRQWSHDARIEHARRLEGVLCGYARSYFLLRDLSPFNLLTIHISSLAFAQLSSGCCSKLEKYSAAVDGGGNMCQLQLLAPLGVWWRCCALMRVKGCRMLSQSVRACCELGGCFDRISELWASHCNRCPVAFCNLLISKP
jgi:hypothetical protein